eukprot:CAMPEP_0114248160 /NCGR_PEP_ID=MMETSP0058-20121206/13417_1 /TAXON_ID=36894 /ORGANISM="Pyramimonas parkeae, CCMP726" /LENGTH=180 /DNA_ID=CAMNT_0001361533 /DNA_START=147 /DNA_END=689 /DNA_ORIENTATION=-
MNQKTSAVRFGAAKPSPTLQTSGQASSTALRAVKDYSVDSIAPSDTEEQRWGYVICNAKFMLQEEEHMAEVLRERRRMFTEKGRPMDFFIVPEPKWVDALPADVLSRLGRPAAAIVSTDLIWIKFVKLRMDKVYEGAFDAKFADAVASGEFDENFKEIDRPFPYSKYQAGWWKVFLAANN